MIQVKRLCERQKFLPFTEPFLFLCVKSHNKRETFKFSFVELLSNSHTLLALPLGELSPLGD